MAQSIKFSRPPVDNQGKSRVTKIVLSVFAVTTLVFFLGFSIGRSFAPKSSNAKADATQLLTTDNKSHSQVSSLGPRDLKGIVPIGFSHSKDGAVKAVATYLESWPDLLKGDNKYVLGSINAVTATSADDLRVAIASALDDTRKTYEDAIAGQFLHATTPLRYEVKSYDSSNATINFWVSETWAAPNAIEPQISFNTHTMKLVWENNDWKMTSWTTKSGPTPAWIQRDAPDNSLNFYSAMSSYAEYKR